MVDFANNGLTSSADFGQACGVLFGYPCAFPGINPNAPPLPFFESDWAFGVQRAAGQIHRERAATIPWRTVR